MKRIPLVDRGRLRLEPVAKRMAEIMDRDDAQPQEQLRSRYRYIKKIFPLIAKRSPHG